MRQKGFGIICMIALLLLPAAAQAQKKGGVDLKTVAEVEVVTTNAKGEKEVNRVEASQANVAPGDTVIFTVFFVNNGSKPATDIAVKNPVPEHMVYVDTTAEGKGTKIDFSVDKGKTFGSPDKLKVKTPDKKERPATAADYTVIRWIVEKLPPGGKGSVSFRAKIK